MKPCNKTNHAHTLQVLVFELPRFNPHPHEGPVAPMHIPEELGLMCSPSHFEFLASWLICKFMWGEMVISRTEAKCTHSSITLDILQSFQFVEHYGTQPMIVALLQIPWDGYDYAPPRAGSCVLWRLGAEGDVAKVADFTSVTVCFYFDSSKILKHVQNNSYMIQTTGVFKTVGVSMLLLNVPQPGDRRSNAHLFQALGRTGYGKITFLILCGTLPGVE